MNSQLMLFLIMLAAPVQSEPVANGLVAMQWYMVGSNEFRPRQEIDDNVAKWFAYSSYAAFETGSGESRLVAPVRLPVGSEISNLFCQVYDNSSSHRVRVYLYRHDHADNSTTSYEREILRAESSTSGTSGAHKVSDTSANTSYNVVDDWSPGFGGATYYTYSLTFMNTGFCGLNCKLYKCAIGYFPP